MVAITTKYLPTTNTKGTRYVARANGFSETVTAEQFSRYEYCHIGAAIALCKKVG